VRSGASVTAAVLALAATAATAATAAAPKPDAHDRALAARLSAKVSTFREVAASSDDNSLQRSLDRCPLMKKDPGQAFAAVFVLLPALLAGLVNEYRPQLADLRDTVAAMHPHAPVFRQWLDAERRSFGLLLQFDNHGKKIDLCEAATVMLDKHSTADDIHRVLGIDPRLIPKLFQSTSSSKVTKLNPRMRTFFVAAGVSKANAKALTSS
jgi:hypothetical protein